MNYYANEVDGDALIQQAYEGLGNYLNKLPLSYKKKAAVQDAFNDIVNRGIVGFDKGQLMIQNSEGLDMSQYKGFNPYEEAAYYLEGVFKSTSNKPKEPEKPKDKFTNKEMLQDFTNHMSKSRFGGATDLQSLWDGLDVLDENGIRGTQNRKTELINLLENWNPKFDNVDFTDSAFADSNDFHARRQAAIDALKASEGISPQAVEALQRLGLNPGTLLRTGADEMVTYGDKQMTKQQAVEAMAKEKQAAEEQKLAAERAKEEAALKALREVTKSGKYSDYKPTKISSLEELGAKYGSEEAFVKHIQELQQKKDWTVDDIAEIIGYYKAKGGREMNDDERLHYLDNQYDIGFDKNRFNNLKSTINGWKVIDGIQGLYYNPSTNRLRRFIPNEFGTTAGGDLFAQYNPKLQQETYLQQTDFTNADWAELGGIVSDIASIINPEPFSAAGLGIAAAGARNYARTRGPEKWGFWDYASQIGDYLTGAAGAIPLFGDAALAAKTVSNVGRFLRIAMRIPAFLDLWNSTPELIPIGKKIANDEKLTVQDWMNLGTFFRGLATTRQLNVTNRASRKALQERGYEVGNKWHQKLGLTQSKPITESSTLKIKIKGKEEEIPISKEVKENLDKKLSKAENNAEARSKIVREDEGVQAAVQEHMKTKDSSFKVKEETTAADGTKSTKLSDDWNSATVPYNNSLRNVRWFGNKMGLFPSYARTSGGIYGKSPTTIAKNNDNFDTYLSSDRGIWDRIKYGSNRTLRGMDKFNNKVYNLSQNQASTPKTGAGETPSGTNREKIKKYKKETIQKSVNTYREWLNSKEVQTGKQTIGKDRYKVKKDGENFVLSLHGNKLGTFKNRSELKFKIREILKEYKGKDKATVIRELKDKGWYKHGGSFNYFSKYDY